MAWDAAVAKVTDTFDLADAQGATDEDFEEAEWTRTKDNQPNYNKHNQSANSSKHNKMLGRGSEIFDKSWSPPGREYKKRRRNWPGRAATDTN